MSDPKPIPTKYNGVQYRSRLEARWALFFDQLSIDYRYEYEGFQLKSGWYLPDFYLPQHGWFEIKPIEPDARQQQLTVEMHERTYILTGFPLEQTFDAEYWNVVEGNAWMENYDTGEIYFALNIYYERVEKEEVIDFNYPFLMNSICVHCTKFLTCSLYESRGEFLVRTNEFVVDNYDSVYHWNYMNDHNPLMQELESTILNINALSNKFQVEHEALKKTCKFRKSKKVDAAYQLAKNFRFL